MGCGLESVIAHIRACTRCPELVDSRRQPVPGVGEVGVDIMFVGEAPGRHGADRTGRPFEGDRSGDLFQHALHKLEEIHGKPLKVFVTNAVKCNPQDREGRNRPPAASELTACKSHLEAEIRAVRPRVIVALGAKAAKSVLGHANYAWWKAVGGQPRVFPAIHPGFVVRGGGRQRLTRTTYVRYLARVLQEL